MAASARLVAPNADIVSKAHALMVNCSAAKGLQNVLKTNLGTCRPCVLRAAGVFMQESPCRDSLG